MFLPILVLFAGENNTTFSLNISYSRNNLILKWKEQLWCTQFSCFNNEKNQSVAEALFSFIFHFHCEICSFDISFLHFIFITLFKFNLLENYYYIELQHWLLFVCFWDFTIFLQPKHYINAFFGAKRSSKIIYFFWKIIF